MDKTPDGKPSGVEVCTLGVSVDRFCRVYLKTRIRAESLPRDQRQVYE